MELEMANSESNRRIKYALHLDGWNFEGGDRAVLRKNSTKTIPSEYLSMMDENIFCPVCFTNLNRIPKDKDFFSNGRNAYFAHKKTYKHIRCDLRSTRPEGKQYETYEDAQQAIDDENLVIVSEFLKDKPIGFEGAGNEYDETPVEDAAGPLSDMPIGRHNGETFKLPSKISTVAGICRSFDENLYKYYCFPNQYSAVRLLDLLRPIVEVEDEDEIPRLYYGVIKNSFNAGQYPKPENIRMTELHCHSNIHDFFLKVTDRISQEKGINDNSKGRVVLMFGKVSWSGIGLCVKQLSWGEFALLPEKYDNLLTCKY